MIIYVPVSPIIKKFSWYMITMGFIITVSQCYRNIAQPYLHRTLLKLGILYIYNRSETFKHNKLSI